jgi:hypothetical protein
LLRRVPAIRLRRLIDHEHLLRFRVTDLPALPHHMLVVLTDPPVRR